MKIFDPKLKQRPGRYLAQVSLATLSLVVLLWAAELLSGAAVPQAVLVAAIASTAFVLFISPRRDNARPRRVIGSHAIALMIGGALAAFTGTPWGQDLVSDVPMLFAVYAAGGVGLSMLAMAATDTEHGPRRGRAQLQLGAHRVRRRQRARPRGRPRAAALAAGGPRLTQSVEGAMREGKWGSRYSSK